MAKTIKDLIKDYLKEQDLRKAYNGSCDSIEQACEYGANAVLEEIEKELPKSDKILNDYGKALLWRINERIKELKG